MSIEENAVMSEKQEADDPPVSELGDLPCEFGVNEQKGEMEDLEHDLAEDEDQAAENGKGEDMDANEFMENYDEEGNNDSVNLINGEYAYEDVGYEEDNPDNNEEAKYEGEGYEENDNDEGAEKLQPFPVDLTCLSDFDPDSKEENRDEIDYNHRNYPDFTPIELLDSSSPATEPKEATEINKELGTIDDILIESGEPSPKKRKKSYCCVFQHILTKDNKVLDPLEISARKRVRTEGWKCLVGYFNSITDPRHYCPYIVPFNSISKELHGERKIGPLTLTQRKAKIKKYIEKRKRRLWNREVTYAIRKKNANKKFRIKGRFVAEEKLPPLKELKNYEEKMYELPVVEEPIFTFRRVQYKLSPITQ